MRRLFLVVLVALVAVPTAQASVRFATFNASLNRPTEGLMIEHMANPDVDDVYRRQLKNVAEVIQRIRPDVVLINEFDYTEVGGVHPGLALFHDNFLMISQNGQAPINYPYRFARPSNTGIPSGHDFDNDGKSDHPEGTILYGNDAFGFGEFPGKFGMAVYSKYPIDPLGVRTFQEFLWKDMPGNLLPTPWYSPEEAAIFRLSSKSHWDLPIRIGGTTVHFLAAHPTPPVFDGPEDRNGRRNHDEIRLWADYVMPGRGGYIYDDAGRRGGVKPGEPFVIAGDYNSDPLDGDSIPGSAQLLLEHPLVNTKVTPESAGAVEAAELQGRANETHKGDPRFDTADFADGAPGNLRVDYVLPSKSLRIVDSGVFWPLQADPLSRLTGVFSFDWIAVGGFPTSDHRSVWVDVEVPGTE